MSNVPQISDEEIKLQARIIAGYDEEKYLNGKEYEAAIQMAEWMRRKYEAILDGISFSM